MNGRIDVAVVGGGPIGLATALHARAAGLDVVVVEPRSAPIDKACGEGLMPSALRRLGALGVDPPGRPILGIRYLDAVGRRQAAARFTGDPGRGVCRTTLHSALVDRAKESDVTTMTGRVVDLSQDASGASVTLATGEQVRARYVVGADGLHSRVRRAVGLEPVRARRPRFGQRRHFGVEPWSDLVEVHWAEHVEAYVTPVSDHAVGVALLTSLRGSGWDDLVDRFPLLGQRLAGAAPLDTCSRGRTVAAERGGPGQGTGAARR